METACASEMLVPTNKIKWCHNPEDHSLNNKVLALTSVTHTIILDFSFSALI
ncbi:hypothetical protein B7P43_G02344 [Cryptotermes secundus]|uniref:Uncharacterized protein n=1 Tax=Cryptotermes secundus TaxID=105785 RepID=A0A2J7PT28_9NEOP|nr:hypothetical protein B7P43_G02344 [Cryptotermes secundus]